MKDITSSVEVLNIITNFYKKANKDDLLGPIFQVKIPADHWDVHMDTIAQFWCGVLFQTGDYSGRPFPKHIGLGLQKYHFERWLTLFNETIDNTHSGEKADLMKAMAQNMATMFLKKLNHIDESPNMISII